MGLASSLNTALTGLQAAETIIDVTGNNLANTSTVGFKESTAQFATQFLQTMSLGSAPTDNSGGTNPRQTGLGTLVAAITPDFTQGTIQISASPSDLAIQGEGFFIVQGTQGEELYTRNGIFQTNADNELVTIAGQRLLGYGVDEDFQVVPTELVPLTIPLGSAAVAQPTANVWMEGVLRPNGDIATTAEVIESTVLGDGIAPQADTGTTASSAVVPDTTTSTAASNNTGGALLPGETYRYRFAFVDASGQESLASQDSVPPGASPSVTIAAGGNSVALNNIPSDTSATNPYQAVNIYRTTNGGTDYFLAGQVPNGTATFTDGTADGGLGAQLVEDSLDGQYNYYITYFRAGSEESRPSPLIGPVNVVDNRIHLTNLPAAPPPVPPGGGFPAYDQIRIYRNLATDSSTFHLVDTIPFGQDYTDSASDATIQANQQLNLDGPGADSNTLLTEVVTRDLTSPTLAYTNPFQEGTLSFTARKGGRDLAPQDFTITATSTVQDLIDFMVQAQGIQPQSADPTSAIPGSENTLGSGPATLSPGGSISNGQIRFVGNNGVANAVEIGNDAFLLTPTGGGTLNPSLGFGSIQEAVGESAVTDFLAYDSLGTPMDVRVTAVLESQTDTTSVYRWFADSADNDPATGAAIAVGTGQITFDGEGRVVPGLSNSTVSIRRDTNPAFSPLDFDLDFSGMSGLASTTPSELSAARQDGSGAGTLTNFIIAEDGLIHGVFSNGVTRDLGQIRLARFANPSGLEQLGENLFATGVNSGLPIEGNPNANGIGAIKAGAIELSNTDIGKNLIDLILASTQYRSNTRVITTSQQLLDELLNLRR